MFKYVIKLNSAWPKYGSNKPLIHGQTNLPKFIESNKFNNAYSTAKFDTF